MEIITGYIERILENPELYQKLHRQTKKRLQEGSAKLELQKRAVETCFPGCRVLLVVEDEKARIDTEEA